MDNDYTSITIYYEHDAEIQKTTDREVKNIHYENIPLEVVKAIEILLDSYKKK